MTAAWTPMEAWELQTMIVDYDANGRKIFQDPYLVSIDEDIKLVNTALGQRSLSDQDFKNVCEEIKRVMNCTGASMPTFKSIPASKLPTDDEKKRMLEAQKILTA